ncbi:benzoate 4-monooxygenase cytochrome P450, partial [Xylogone sp. PMI_703]
LACLVAIGIYNYFFHPLANVPGPLSGAISPFWAIRVFYQRRPNYEFEQVHAKYGPAVRIGPSQLSFATPEAEETIYANQPREMRGKFDYFSKANTIQEMFSAMGFKGRNIGTIRERDLHSQLKKRLQPALSNKALLGQESLHYRHLTQIFCQLDELIAKGEAIDLTSCFAKMIWNLVFDLSFGEPLVKEKQGLTLDVETFEKLLTFYEKWFPFVEVVNYAMPLLEGVLKFGFSLVPAVTMKAILPSAKLRDCIDRHDGHKDILTAILSAQEMDKGGIHMTEEEIHSNSVMLFVAGYKTTETAHSAIMYYLLREPHHMKRLQDELHSIFHTLYEITGEKLRRLPFLNGCINESLHLISPVASKFQSRISPGTTIDGIYVPAGTEVFSETHTMQRSAQYWANPSSFCPERWFDNGPGTIFANDKRGAYRPFGSGPRMCIGREVALHSLRLTVSRLAFRYKIEMKNRDTFLGERDVASTAVYSNYKTLVRLTKLTAKDASDTDTIEL